MSCYQNDVILEACRDEAEKFIDQKIADNPTIPNEAREQLIKEKYQELVAKEFSRCD